MYIDLRRPAIAMIELIFAIVIMGIVMMSAPMLIGTAAQSTSAALQQEGINEAVSRVSMILTYAWDENNNDTTCIPPVLHVASGDSALDEVGTTARRVGVPVDTDSHTFKCGSLELNASATLGSEGAEKNDIDDFTNSVQLDPIAIGSGGIDYIEKTTVNIDTTINYISDTANYNQQSFAYAPGTGSGDSSNIKEIIVNLTSSSDANELSNKNIVLKAFSCNIGGYDFARRIIY